MEIVVGYRPDLLHPTINEYWSHRQCYTPLHVSRLINKHENASVCIWYPVCHIHKTVQLVTSLMTPAQTHQCPYCLPEPLLGTRRQKATGKKGDMAANQHSLSFWTTNEIILK